MGLRVGIGDEGRRQGQVLTLTRSDCRQTVEPAPVRLQGVRVFSGDARDR